jgi:hypothetical protein
MPTPKPLKENIILHASYLWQLANARARQQHLLVSQLALEERMVTALETYVDLLARSELGGEEGKRMEMEKTSVETADEKINWG